MLTQKQALDELAQCDHGFLTSDGAKTLAEPFGVVPAIRKVQDNRSEFKGLYVPSVNEGDWVEGVEAHILAMQICSKLKLKYLPMHGIGSQLRVCCQAIREHLEK